MRMLQKAVQLILISNFEFIQIEYFLILFQLIVEYSTFLSLLATVLLVCFGHELLLVFLKVFYFQFSVIISLINFYFL